MQANSIAKHLGTTSVTSLSYESYVEMMHTFSQTIDHANRKAVEEKSHCKAFQAEFNGGHNTNHGGGHSSGHGRNTGRSNACQANPGGCRCGKYHNWIPRDQFDNLDDENYQQLIRERVARGEVQANTTSMPLPLQMLMIHLLPILLHRLSLFLRSMVLVHHLPLIHHL